MSKKNISSDQAMEKMQRIFRERGSKALEMAIHEVLDEKVECNEVREAMSYFMNEYWHDLARPSLLSLVCEAVGGNPEETTPIAVPMTLVSGAIDIHDDIIDQSKTKYGRPTVYGKYGKDLALLVGDALLFKGLVLLNQAVRMNIPAERMRIIIGVIKNTFFEVGDAEALELQFRRNLDASPRDYLRVVRKKAADVEAHARIGAILGGASPKKVEALGEYGRILGMLIILRDDWIDVLDVEESLSRINRESLPLPLLLGLQRPAIKGRLKTVLLKRAVTRKDAQFILQTIQETDVPRKYAKLMSRLAENAISKLKTQKVKVMHLKQLIKATLSSLIETET